jgi:hypothetical protein
MHVTAAGLETVGTFLQFAGSGITLYGLVRAWLTATRKLRHLRSALGGGLAQIQKVVHDVVHEIITPAHARITGQRERAVARMNPEFSGYGELSAAALAFDTTEKRLNNLEHANEALRDQLEVMDTSLSAEIKNANTELAKANAEQIKGLYPALFGIVVSIAGYISALGGYLIT